MERPRLTCNTSILAGIGLVLIGLLAGILLMLVFDQRGNAEARRPQVVERVELGGGRPMVAVSPSDSGAWTPMSELGTLTRTFKQVSSQATPSVVAIRVELDGSSDVPRDWFHNFDEDARRFFREHVPRQSVGSGVIISPQGYIVTNHHVVNEASKIHVALEDRREFEAEVVGIDPSTDLAVIRVRADNLPALPFGNSDEVEVGEWVLAIGNPFRLSSTVTAGIVSALGRQVNIIDDNFRIEDFIQTDAAINPGNSGGALVNMRGELVGINTAIATESGSYEGYGFAVPSNLMRRVTSDLVAHGEVRRGFLGVEIREINAHAAKQLGLERIGGVYLGRVRSGGAADRAGLERGDVVLAVNGHSVDAPNELQSVIAQHRPGDLVALSVWRAGKTRRVQVELMGPEAPAYQGWLSDLRGEKEQQLAPQRPPSERHPDAQLKELEAWGLGLRGLSKPEREAFEAGGGAYIAYVEKGKAADLAGLPRDVVIVRVADEAVATVEEALLALTKAAQQGETVLLRVKRRDGVTAFYEVTTGEH